ncbi:MAG: trigger factor [Deltaproteobacteria bacterium]|nr:MAG: trigger factor [Deltaproteobacteria bacterium]
MKTDVEQLTPTSKKLSIEIDASEVDKRIDRAYREIRKRAKIKGFRPGKAPLKLLERYYGPQVIEDVQKELISETFPKALQESELAPLNFPMLEKGPVERGKSFKYSAIMEVRPEIQLSEYLGIEVEKEEVSVSDSDVEERLEQIRKAHGKLTPVDPERPVREGDYVIVEYEAFSGDQPIEGMRSTNFMIKIGSGDFHPEVERGLLGAQKGEEREIHVDFEPDYFHNLLAGKPVDFKIKIIDIKEMELPQIDDEFAKRLDPDLENVEALKAKVRELILQEREREAERDVKARLMDKIAEGLEVALPQSMVESEILDSIESIKQDLLRSGSSLEKAGLSEEKLRQDFRPVAEKKVKNSLILTEIAKKENISVGEEDLDEAFEDIAKATGQDAEPLRRYYEARGLIDSMRQRLLEQKTLNYLLEHANIIIKKPANRPLETGNSNDKEST